MIFNYTNRPLETKPKQLNTCLHKSINWNTSSFIIPKNLIQPYTESTTSKMSRMATSVAASAANKETIPKPPMEAVTVNSIIYSKPSFCRISVDLEDTLVNKKSTNKAKLTTGTCTDNASCFSETICASPMDSKNSSLKFDAVSCLTGLAASTLDVDDDTKLYRMCTTLNGSISHQISDLCDNILAMTGFYGHTSDDQDDDSFIEFAYRDESTDDDDEDDEVDFIYDEDDYNEEDDEDNDVVDFSYECPIEPVPKLCCDKRKKVRFNTKPTVHNMHTWNYAYRAARKGEWEMYARDRERFKLRIQRTALILNPVLEREHRQKIYEKRFGNLFNKDESQNDVSLENIESKETSVNVEPKKTHQKKKRKKKRFCKQGSRHYF